MHNIFPTPGRKNLKPCKFVQGKLKGKKQR